MERLLPMAPIVVLSVALLVGSRLWNRRRLRLAEEAHRAEIEAFVDWLLGVETVRDREAIADVGRSWGYRQECAFVYLKRGGWFELHLRSSNGLGDFTIAIWNVDGRSLPHFPPDGTRCRSPWFIACMTRLQNLVDYWPQEWTGSGRARRVIGGRPDPLYVPHEPT